MNGSVQPEVASVTGTRSAPGEELAGLAATSAAFELASRLAGYPSTEALARARELAAALATVAVADVRRPPDALLAMLADAGLTATPGEEPSALQALYIDAFDRGIAQTPLHGSEYGRGRALAKGARLADVAGFYRAFGVQPTPGELLDHVAVELEFVAFLLAKERYLAGVGDDEGVAVVSGGRKLFLGEHLGPLALAVAARPGLAQAPFYACLHAWVAELVMAMASELEIELQAAEPVAGELEPDTVCCAGAPTAESPLVGLGGTRGA